jgi:hypothetical protein
MGGKVKEVKLGTVVLHYAYYTGSDYHNRKEVQHNKSKIKVKYYAQALSSQLHTSQVCLEDPSLRWSRIGYKLRQETQLSILGTHSKVLNTGRLLQKVYKASSHN